MNKIKLTIAIMAMMIAAVFGGYKVEAQKAVVIYYSQTSNTKVVAEEIASRLGAEMEEIIPVVPYDGDFQSTIERCMQEREQDIQPKINPLNVNLQDYDIVFIGYPIWFGTFAPPISAFLDQVDLKGKKVVPFCTFGSGGLESSIMKLEEMHTGADIMPGYGVRAARMKSMPEEVDLFLKANGFIKGDFITLEDFSEQHLVNEEESAIFDAAVGDYPMINARAKTVAMRDIPGGIEYLFIAEDLPREDVQSRPNAGGMKVYVIVKDGEEPVFTKVIR